MTLSFFFPVLMVLEGCESDTIEKLVEMGGAERAQVERVSLSMLWLKFSSLQILDF